MPEIPEKSQPTDLSERIERHRKEIQKLVAQGGEQPRYEFKRELLLNADPAAKLRFIKLVQAIANNFGILEECCIVIGADPREHKFYPVPNVNDFDQANLEKILASSLEPVPDFEQFTVKADSDETFVIVAISAKQRRPIVVKRQMEVHIPAPNGSRKALRLEVGDIWIKKNTHTAHALRTDIEAMYNLRIEDESENRARKRLRHLQELGSFSIGASSSKTIPDFGLLVGPKNDLRQFADELIISGKIRPLRMLLEHARETLVHRWDGIGARSSSQPEDIQTFGTTLQDFYTNDFRPVVESIVELGLIIVKNDMETEWLNLIIEYLMEAFESARGLQTLKHGRVITDPNSIEWWRPGFDIYVGIRTVAAYIVMRKRHWFLSALVPRTVTAITMDDTVIKRVPVLFFPLGITLKQFEQGRAEFFWKERVESAWGSHFGGNSNFLKSSQQLEFVLEFNSYCGTMIKDANVQRWKQHSLEPRLSFNYFPDLYKNDLQHTVPMAERIYDIVASGERFPPYLAVNPVLVDLVFQQKEQHERLAIYGDFLLNLQRWQADVRFKQYKYWGYAWSWEGRLEKLVDQARERCEQQQ